jgi:hypothetical protein
MSTDEEVGQKRERESQRVREKREKSYFKLDAHVS